MDLSFLKKDGGKEETEEGKKKNQKNKKKTSDPMRKSGASGKEGFPGGLDSKESACNEGDLASVPGSGRSPGEGNGNTLQ